MFTVLVCGGRDYGDLASLGGDRKHQEWPRLEKEYRHILVTLTKLSMGWPRCPEDQYGNWLPDVKIISGAARGVDTVAIDWAILNWCGFQEYKADWETYGNAAGPIRNQQMLDEGKPDLVVAFPGGKGTADMVRQAKAKGLSVIEIM